MSKAKKSILLVYSLLMLFSLILTGCRDSSIDPEDLEAQTTKNSGSSGTTIAAGSTTSAASDSSTVKNPVGTESLNASLDSSKKEILSELDTSANLTGKVLIDGSAMMSPISEKIAEAFRKNYPKMQIGVEISGTDEGIKSFINRNIDICSTSRALNENESSKAKSAGGYVELKVAYDGVVLVVNKSNPIDCITIDEIKQIWAPDSTVSTWNEVNSKWPGNDLMIFGPKTDTGLIGFFCNKILGTNSGEIGSYSEVENDSELIKSINGDNNSIAITGFANYFANKRNLKAVKVDTGSGPVLPSIEAIKSGSYNALSSPMYIYVNKNSLERQEIKAFVKYYLENASKIVMGAGYVPLSDSEYKAQIELIK